MEARRIWMVRGEGLRMPLSLMDFNDLAQAGMEYSDRMDAEGRTSLQLIRNR